jgi:alpha-glucosidase
MTIPGSASAADLDAASRWWLDGVVYQVYPRSFADSNGDGVGDLPGLIDHLDHLAGGADSLGVDAIWLSPIYLSPMLDGGYDVMDHTAVDPVFGTLADLDRLIEECHRRRIRVILDLVMNHTSNLHPWFVQSRQSRTGPFADFFLWRDPSGWDRDGRPEPPNNWLSWFGGSAWEWEPGEQFYLHTFPPEQPDVNWRCRSSRGDGRWSGAGSTAASMGSAPTAQCLPQGGREMPSNRRSRRAVRSWDSQEHRHDKDQPELHDLLPSSDASSTPGRGRATVGELFTSGIEDAGALGAAPPLSDWVLLETSVDGGVFRAAIAAREAAWSDRWPTIKASNHDHSRHVSRYLHTLGRRDRATADAVAKPPTIERTLRGTPFLYYGEEIGAQDIAVPRSRARDRAAVAMAGWWNRDGCRAPMTWSGDAKAGFTSGQPWLPIPPDAASRNVERQRASEGTVLAHYRRLLALRRGSAALRTGEPALVDVGDPGRPRLSPRAGDEAALVVVRFGLRGGEIELPTAAVPWRVVLEPRPGHAHESARVAVRPIEAIILQP